MLPKAGWYYGRNRRTTGQLRVLCKIQQYIRCSEGKEGDAGAGEVGADCGLRIADCGLWIVDCGLRIADCGLRIVDCGLRIADCGFEMRGDLEMGEGRRQIDSY